MKTKTIVLSENEEKLKSGRAILTLSVEDGLLKCKLRLYNISPLNRFCKLGIYHNEEVFSGNLIERQGSYESSMVGDFDFDKDFYCALVDTSKDNLVLLSGGTYAGMFFSADMVEKGLDAFADLNKELGTANLFEDDDIDSAHTTNADNNLSSPYDESKEFNINNLGSPCEGSWHEQSERLRGSKDETTSPPNKLDTSHHKGRQDFNDMTTAHNMNQDIDAKHARCCENCIYKQKFYETQINSPQDETTSPPRHNSAPPLTSGGEINETLSTQSAQTENLKQEKIVAHTSTEEQSNDFLSSILPQFDYIFDTYPADDTLNTLLENSKFVHINDDHDGYSIGAIYADNEMKFICYAVKGEYNSTAPAELGTNYQWLPLDKDDPLSDGYFVVFQDAHDLKILTF